MKIFNTIPKIREALREIRRDGMTIGFVPTMGFLHEGHLSLIRIAKRRADVVVVSIYVNPMQFSAGEDLAAYPRDFRRDETLCENEGVNFIFYPNDEEIYPDGFATRISVEGLKEPLCGRSRPSHFDGVATVVAKLFNIVEPDLAVFGKKDFQQLAIIRRMTRDLDFPIEIVGGETVRERDGLAMSSRNKYLSPAEREVAPTLYRALRMAKQRIEDGGAEDSEAVKRVMRAQIESADAFEIDYIEIVDPETLIPVANPSSRKVVIALAVRLGAARLIDNIEVGF
ncbi:MAG TPA: pantoate--beta-alanine ligase [candidate division Zixibacteria bacterium]|nr:pantoate--beta-alanine ligase [candidate division Zixibacteria bacterium]